MGREQELRDAARDGNVAKLESLLSGKKSSLMSSLRKALDINCQDDNGNTALHLAALNGRRDAASLLLQNDASANIPETLGNYPLHLAAFNGHHEVTDVLLNQGPSRADVLQQNSAEDTPLHIAAQYGHTQVVKTLLECHADPHMRNKKGESPLDLAAMYGRLPTVQVLILSDGSIVNDHTQVHSPLHLAARNGHTSVIESLLDFGMPVNTMCNPGSALHEAALFGKIEAVKLLLKKGIDVNATNDNDDKVLDLLEDLPSERSQEITALIYEQTQLMMNSVQTRSKSMSITSQGSNGMVPGRPADTSKEESNHYSKITANPRSVSVSQRPTQPAYNVVQYPRISRSDQSLAHASVSPLPLDPTSQEDLFNDHFLREMSAPSPTSVERPGGCPEVSTLESKKRSTYNVYEETPAPESKANPLAIYDVVPPPRQKAGPVTPQSSRDSVPSFPPPSSDQAISTLKNYVEVQKRTKEVSLASDTNGRPGENTGMGIVNSANEQQAMSNFEKLHLRMSPPLECTDTYDNINITNQPSEKSNPLSALREENLISFSAEESQPRPPSLQFSSVKQVKTRSSIKEKSSIEVGSRPASTLNESYEWSKIDSIFSSFEDLIQCDINLDEDDLEHMSLESVGEWLSSLGLSHYEASFVANGYDDIRFIGGDMLDEDDLREIGIQNTEHVRQILTSAGKVPSPPQIGEHDFPIPESILEWLTRINLQDYEKRFQLNGYDSMDRVRAIWEFELTTVIGIHLNGHRKRMIYSLGRRPEQEREKISWSQKFAAAEAPKKAPTSSGDDAMDLANQLLKAAEDMVQGFENRQGGPKCEDVSETISAEPETAKSPTSPKILKYQPSFQWIHKPETLLYSAVAYETQYLGSHPVMVVRGTQSTVDACKKMKSTSKMLQKIPTIQLSISVRGIDFIDAQSNSTISSYDIRYISYCAQDPDDLAIFAYITKDSRSGKNYCHVFKGANLSLTDEIVLTIGQAFELAYHQHRVLIEGAKQGKPSESENVFHEASNELQMKRVSSPDGRAPPPMPRPYGERKHEKESADRI